MSRKWERMVERNQKNVNKRRKKQGVPEVGRTGAETMRTFRGRSWLLPLLLTAFSLFFLISFGNFYNGDGMYWFTVIGYLGLALLIFAFRRPSLRIGKAQLASKRFSGDRLVGSDDVERITLMDKYIIIQLKNRRSQWMFSRFIHLFPVAQAAEELKLFAQRNQVALSDERGKKDPKPTKEEIQDAKNQGAVKP